MNTRANRPNINSLPLIGGAVEVCLSSVNTGADAMQGSLGSSGQQSRQLTVGHHPPACVLPPNAGIDRHTTTDSTNRILLSIDLTSDENSARRQLRILRSLYQTVARHSDIQDLARHLIRLAELAYGCRDICALGYISNLLSHTPNQAARNAGGYYQAVIAKRAGDSGRAKELLSALSGPRSIQTLATVYECEGDFDGAARLHLRALRRGDVLTTVNASLQLSSIRSIEGDHSRALDDLARLLPVVRVAARLHPHLWPLIHNELAVELLALGRLEDARRASDVATASPVARAYPEWAETAQEIRDAEARPVQVASPPAGKEQHEDSRNNAGIIIPEYFNPSRRRENPPIAIITPRALTLARISARVIKSNPPTGPPLPFV